MGVFSAPDYTSDDEEAQQTQQATTAAGQCDVATENLWGYLFPLNSPLQRIDFNKTRLSYRLGRDYKNDVVLPGLIISSLHCSISWNGEGGLESQVVVFDNSKNGTLVNRSRIGKGRKALLHHGDEVLFGGSQFPEPSGGPPIEYRYLYVHQGTKASRTGVSSQYMIGRECGRGAFATVFEATHRTTKELYAVKMIYTKRYIAKSGQIDIFAREIEIMMTLKHPNIVRLREIFKDESKSNILMEFVRGGNLFDYVLRKGGLTERHTRYIAKQMCEAMSYMHQSCIAHRDLKPENVLLTDTIPVVVKIADFGLAKAFDDRTFLKTMCGTLNYLAPEVIARGEKYDCLVDSWSMGVTTYFMLTNAFPFTGIGNQDFEKCIQARTIQWSRLEKVAVSDICRNFVDQLLTADPAKRMSLSDSLNHPWLLSA